MGKESRSIQMGPFIKDTLSKTNRIFMEKPYTRIMIIIKECIIMIK
jgi:hypothetical protein